MASAQLDPYSRLPFLKQVSPHYMFNCPQDRLHTSQSEKLRFSSANPFTPTYVASNLSLSSDPMGMYNTRVKGRQILLENPARESRAKKELEAKRAAKKKEKERKKLGVIGKKEAKEKGVWRFDENQAK
jgi:ribonuclease P protein subunit POP4